MKKDESELVRLLKSVALLGLGTVKITKKKASELVAMLKKQGVTEEEGEKFVKEIIQKNKEEMAAIEKKIEKMVEKAMAKLKPATKKELKALETRIKKLEKKLK